MVLIFPNGGQFTLMNSIFLLGGSNWSLLFLSDIHLSFLDCDQADLL